MGKNIIYGINNGRCSRTTHFTVVQNWNAHNERMNEWNDNFFANSDK